MEKILDSITQSRFPITKLQLDRFLSKYGGKPKLAQENVSEIIDIKTTSIAKGEHEAFTILKRGVERAMCLTKNLKLKQLSERLDVTLDKAEQISNISPLSSNADKIQEGTSSHLAKAALLLRRDAIQVALDYWRFATLIQTNFRCYYTRCEYLLSVCVNVLRLLNFRTQLYSELYLYRPVVQSA